MKKISLIYWLITSLLFIFGTKVYAQQIPLSGSNTLVGGVPEIQIDSLRSIETSSIIRVEDEGWSGISSCFDCSKGWATDIWELTLTEERVVSLVIEDCCMVGDYYELWIDGKKIGRTEKVEFMGSSLSTGQFVATLKGGTHQIKVRNAAFQKFSSDELSYMCPSSFYLSWILGETTNSWWNAVKGALGAAAKKIGLTFSELFARLNGLGSIWSVLTDSWKVYKAIEIEDEFNNPDSRARLIDEAYNNYGGKNVKFRSRVDDGVGLSCDLIGCSANNWNELTYDQKRDQTVWLSVCGSIGGGFCSGYLLPAFGYKWLE